jgi:flavin-dependent dehydrogenase
MHDVAIAGGGPAGLAAAIRSARRGFRTVLFERGGDAPDKACGEGLMPSGARELARLGVEVAADDRAPFRGIRYLQEDGTTLEARFEGATGMGIRRTALARALRDRARACGAELLQGSVIQVRSLADCAELRTTDRTLEARLVIAADGLHSPLRKAAGLDAAAAGPLRYGIRRHFALSPWTDFVEVYWAPDAEAYVTPVGPRTVNVAFLRRRETAAGFDGLLEHFPALQRKLSGAPAASEERGAGPLLQRTRARCGPRLALVGDAAGYVDAITGQGLSLAFAASAILMQALPDDLSADLAPALRRYDRGLQSRWIRYALPAHGLLALSRRPPLRRAALRALAKIPPVFAILVRALE